MSAPLLSIPAPDAAASAQVLRRLELAIVRRLDGRDSGDHTSYAYGPGSERAGARPYAPGDDARLVDWNLTARSGQVWVRQTEADRELETWVVVDRSASLDFGTADCEKRDVALGAAAAFGMLTLRGAGTPRLSRSGRRRSPTSFMGWFTTRDAAPTAASPVAAARRPADPPSSARPPATRSHGLEKLANSDTRLSGSSSSGVLSRATER